MEQFYDDVMRGEENLPFRFKVGKRRNGNEFVFIVTKEYIE